jgi:hypothetical protein
MSGDLFVIAMVVQLLGSLKHVWRLIRGGGGDDDDDDDDDGPVIRRLETNMF